MFGKGVQLTFSKIGSGPQISKALKFLGFLTKKDVVAVPDKDTLIFGALLGCLYIVVAFNPDWVPFLAELLYVCCILKCVVVGFLLSLRRYSKKAVTDKAVSYAVAELVMAVMMLIWVFTAFEAPQEKPEAKSEATKVPPVVSGAQEMPVPLNL
eukprot:CAMPEP_0175144322 /NCGR_PEP_ID=MMETSP0087-20121206/14058_1 /TAXON_ID=136419 /ORGANISM="Unknown Unknown, Strain D1" /LENGTH=153 /DNA_ID=CAMNT_0016428759 /DNA_START=138 /DNA_END=599 /DNA_ORIENTATION=-